MENLISTPGPFNKNNWLPGVIVVLLGSLIPLSSMAGWAEFDLIKNNDQLCKFEYTNDSVNEKPSYCLKLMNPSQPDIDLVKASRFVQDNEKPQDLFSSDSLAYTEKAGGTILLNEEHMNYILTNYQTLSLRDLAIDWNKAEADRPSGGNQKHSNILHIPFLARLFWKGHTGINGTILIDGRIDLSINDLVDQLEDGKDSDTFLNQMVKINNFSDSCVDATKPGLCLRVMTKLARSAHFRILHYRNSQTFTSDTEAQTNYLLQTIIGRVVIGEFYSQFMRNVQELFNFYLQEGKRLFEESLERIQ